MALKNLFGKAVDVNEVVKEGKDIVKAVSSKEQGSRRHETDMMSDNKLSKNIRPIIMIWTYSLFTIMLFCIVIFKTEFPQIVMNSIFVMSGICLGFYFPGRTVEKWIKSKL